MATSLWADADLEDARAEARKLQRQLRGARGRLRRAQASQDKAQQQMDRVALLPRALNPVPLAAPMRSEAHSARNEVDEPSGEGDPIVLPRSGTGSASANAQRRHRRRPRKGNQTRPSKVRFHAKRAEFCRRFK